MYTLKDEEERTEHDERFLWVAEDAELQEVEEAPEEESIHATLSKDARAFRDAGDQEGERLCLKALADDPDDLPALTRLAAKLEPEVRRRFLAAVAAAKDGIDMEQLATALLSGQVPLAEAASRIDLLAARAGDLAPALRQGFLLGAAEAHGNLAAVGLTMSFDLMNPHAASWVERRAGLLVTELSDETLLAVREIVERAFREGRDIRATARAIRDVVGLHSRQARAVENFRSRLEADGISGDRLEERVGRYAQAQLRLRSRTIARTETLRGSSEGQRSLWMEAKNQGLLDPATTRRRWLLTLDDRLDLAICEPMGDDARGLVGLDEPWELPNGLKVMVPQEAHPNCRCSAALEFKRD